LTGISVNDQMSTGCAVCQRLTEINQNIRTLTVNENWL